MLHAFIPVVPEWIEFLMAIGAGAWGMHKLKK